MHLLQILGHSERANAAGEQSAICAEDTCSTSGKTESD